MRSSSRVTPSVLLAVLAITLAVFAGDADAATNSSVDQYTEGIPGAGGEVHSGATSDGRLPDNVRDELDDAGPAGVAAAALAEGTAPAGWDSGFSAGGDDNKRGGVRTGTGGNGDGGTGAGPGRTPAAEDGGASAIDLVGNGSGGMGIALPLILLLAAAGAIAFVVMRSRGHAPSETPG